MLTEERYAYILNELTTHGTVKSQDLTTALNTSESTIRRDLDNLETEGKLQRIHGGAKKINLLQAEMDMNEKSVKNTQEKEKIARAAVKIIQAQDTIYLDAGSTTYHMIPALQNLDVTVVTNGIQHATLLADYQIKTILIGGTIKFSTKAIVGGTSLQELAQYQFDKAFLGTNGIDAQFGFTTPDNEEAILKKTAMKQSAETFFLADDSKFDDVFFCKIAAIDVAHLLTNHVPINYQKFTNLQEV